MCVHNFCVKDQRPEASEEVKFSIHPTFSVNGAGVVVAGFAWLYICADHVCCKSSPQTCYTTMLYSPMVPGNLPS